jgi:hypothetical protein
MTGNRQQRPDAGVSTNPGSDQTEIQRLVQEPPWILSQRLE